MILKLHGDVPSCRVVVSAIVEVAAGVVAVVVDCGFVDVTRVVVSLLVAAGII